MRGAYSSLVLSGGFWLLETALDMPSAAEVIDYEDGAWFLRTGAVRPDGTVERFQVPVHEIHPNLILFLVFAIVTPVRHLRRCWIRVAVAFAMLVASHCLVFAIGISHNVGMLLLRRGAGFALEPETVNVFGYLVRLHSTVLFPLIPLLLFLPIWVARPPRERRRTVVTERVRPNAPCPCGSGRKYKRCCGAR